MTVTRKLMAAWMVSACAAMGSVGIAAGGDEPNVIPLFEYNGGPQPKNVQVVDGDPEAVLFGVPRQFLYQPPSPLIDSLSADPFNGFGTFPGIDDPSQPGMMIGLGGFAPDPLNVRANIAIVCIEVVMPGTPPTFRWVRVTTKRAAGFEITPEAQAVIDGGGKNYWAAQARKLAKLAASRDPDDADKADRLRRRFQRKNNGAYDTLADGTRYMEEVCETTETIEIIPGTPGTTFKIYIVVSTNATWDSLGEFVSGISVDLVDAPSDSLPVMLGSTEDFDLVIENVDDLGPVPVTDFSGPAGTGGFDMPVIDMNDPAMCNPQNAVWLVNSSIDEVLFLDVPGHPPMMLPPDSEVAFNDLGEGGVIVAEGSLGSFATIDVLPKQPCLADFNGDGVVDFFDVQSYLKAFSAGDPSADVIADGVFDFFDVQAFLQSFSDGCA